MMVRYALSTILFLLAFLFETSFLSSLPLPFPLTPFVFGTGVYLLQHQGLMDGFIWIVALGFMIQLLHLNILPLPALTFLFAGGVSLLSARHVFSNRSLYGVIACALTGYVALVMMEALVLVIHTLGESSMFHWSLFLTTHAIRIILLIIVITILYTLARPIRLLLSR